MSNLIKEEDIKEQSTNQYEEVIENIDNKYGNGNCTYNDLEDIAKEMLSSIPKLDRKALRKEMGEMHVDVFTDPTTANINEGLALVQGYKERLAGILVLAQREYQVRAKVFDMLMSACMVVSKQSSADKRKGEAVMRYPHQLIHLEAAETFMTEVKQFLDNMKAVGETISRQVSVLQLQLSIGEIHKKPAEEVDWN